MSYEELIKDYKEIIPNKLLDEFIKQAEEFKLTKSDAKKVL